jgi:hypothetical protein
MMLLSFLVNIFGLYSIALEDFANPTVGFVAPSLTTCSNTRHYYRPSILD